MEENVIIQIKQPKYGWSGIFLQDGEQNKFYGSLSYIDNPIFDLLKAIEIHFKEDIVTGVTFDEEGAEFSLMIENNRIQAIGMRTKCTIDTLWIYDTDFAIGVCDEFEKDLDLWVRLCYMDEDDEANF